MPRLLVGGGHKAMMLSDVSLSDVCLTQLSAPVQRSRISAKGNTGVASGQMARGVGLESGVPSPVEWGLGRGCAPPQKKNEI